MATFNVTYAPPSGETFVELVDYSGGTVTFPTTPVAGDQISGTNALTYGTDGSITGATGTYLVRHRIAASGVTEPATLNITASDTTAPILTNPNLATLSESQLVATVTTDEDNGTIFARARVGGTAADEATIIAEGTQRSVNSTGVKSVTIGGLAPAITYTVDIVHRDAAGNISTVVTTGTATTESVVSSATFSFTYQPAPGRRLAELESGFDTYAFTLWNAGSAKVGMQLETIEANGYFRNDGSYYDAGTPGTHPLLVIDTDGMKYPLTVDSTGLISLGGASTVSMTVPADGTYGELDTLAFTVTYDDVVTVTGVPRLILDVGGTTAYANYVSGSGTDTLTFEYVVASGYSDLDGIAVTEYEGNGGTVVDSGSIQTSFNLPAVPDTSGIIVDAFDPVGTISSFQTNTLSPQITGTVDQGDTAISISPGGFPATNNGDGTWTLDAGIITLTEGTNAVTATFTDIGGNVSQANGFIEVSIAQVAVTINDLTTADITPTITGTVSIVPAQVEIEVNGVTYIASITNNDWAAEITNALPYDTYTVTVTAEASNGSVAVDTASLTITDAVVPQLLQVNPPTLGVYKENEVLTVDLVFSEPVTVTGVPAIGTPYIDVNIGGLIKTFLYDSGSGSNVLSFNYTAQVGDNSQGIIIGAFHLDGVTIADASGNDAVISFAPISVPLITVDTEAAVITINDQTTSNFSPIVSGTSSEDTVTLTLTIGDDTFNPIVAGGEWSQQITGPLEPGVKTMTLTGVDVAGHVSTPDSAVLTIYEPLPEFDPNQVNNLARAMKLLKQRLGRFTSGPSNLEDFMLDEIQAAQLRLEDGPELPWFMKTRSTGFQTFPGSEVVNLPPNFIRLRDEFDVPVQIEVDGEWRRLLVHSYDQVWENLSGTGTPMAVAVDGPTLTLHPVPDKVYRLKIGYYKKEFLPDPDSVVNNGWLEWAMDLLIAEAGWMLATNYMKNPEAAQTFMQWAIRAKERLFEQSVAYEVAAVESWENSYGR